MGRGAVFNLSHTWRQLGPLRPKVKNPSVEGLYFVGGGTHPGSGLLTIMESANIAADYLARACRPQRRTSRLALRAAGGRGPGLSHALGRLRVRWRR